MHKTIESEHKRKEKRGVLLKTCRSTFTIPRKSCKDNEQGGKRRKEKRGEKLNRVKPKKPENGQNKKGGKGKASPWMTYQNGPRSNTE